MRVASTRRGDSLQCVIVSYCRSCSRPGLSTCTSKLSRIHAANLHANFGNSSAPERRSVGREDCAAMADENATKKARTDVSPATCPQCKKLATLDPAAVLWQDQLWVVVHKKPPCGVVGHLQLLSKRHFRACPTLFRSVCTICSCSPMPLTHHQCVFCMQRALQP